MLTKIIADGGTITPRRLIVGQSPLLQLDTKQGLKFIAIDKTTGKQVYVANPISREQLVSELKNYSDDKYVQVLTTYGAWFPDYSPDDAQKGAILAFGYTKLPSTPMSYVAIRDNQKNLVAQDAVEVGGRKAHAELIVDFQNQNQANIEPPPINTETNTETKPGSPVGISQAGILTLKSKTLMLLTAGVAIYFIFLEHKAND